MFLSKLLRSKQTKDLSVSNFLKVGNSLYKKFCGKFLCKIIVDKALGNKFV